MEVSPGHSLSLIQPSPLASCGAGHWVPLTHLAPYRAMPPSPSTWRLQLHRGGQELQAWGGGLRARSQSTPSATLMASVPLQPRQGPAWPSLSCRLTPCPRPSDKQDRMGIREESSASHSTQRLTVPWNHPF